MRSEQEVFDELAAICVQPGYLHAICWFCFRDNIVKVGDKLKAKDLQNMFGSDRLVRTEITTLIGLALKGSLDRSVPSPTVLQAQITRTEELLKEIHDLMNASWFADLTPEKVKTGYNPFARGEAFREPIFYGGESAYGFQYRDFSPAKYSSDDGWIKANKGFSINDARQVAKAVCDLQAVKLPDVLHSLPATHPNEWTLLPGFEFSVAELSDKSKIDEPIVRAVVQAFALPAGEKNEVFSSLSDFNKANAFPLIPTEADHFLLLQQYTLLEALYDSPFYWMTADSGYWSKATEHRGRFTEQFAAERLAHVFGTKHVFANVDVIDQRGDIAGEIDVLVVFGDRAIVLQAKSKKLTLEARKGNDLQIKDDFKKSVQNSYDQALTCTKLLGNKTYRFVPKGGKELTLPKFEETYIFCVVSDHYPALAFQARQFLKFETDDQIAPPLVLDVFTLDALAEMLHSPLHFLSYANRRARYMDRLMATHELTVLSYHLKKNLWLDDEYSMMLLDDDISTDLDVAMMVRREGFPGAATPDGVLTRFAKTSLGRLITSIERAPHPSTIALGFMLLMLSEDTVKVVSTGIDRIVDAAKKDGKHHDLTVAIGKSDTGLTVHCNSYPMPVSASRLKEYCQLRKYKQKVDSWFGVCLSPIDGSPQCGVNLKEKWQHDSALETATRRMAAPSHISTVLSQPLRKRKLGRNDLCVCGSRKKYKKCCLPSK